MKIIIKWLKSLFAKKKIEIRTEPKKYRLVYLNRAQAKKLKINGRWIKIPSEGKK